jgi:hypothetical protein
LYLRPCRYTQEADGLSVVVVGTGYLQKGNSTRLHTHLNGICNK